MRTILTLAALVSAGAIAGAAQAANPTTAPAQAAAPATVEVKTFEVKAFKPKSLEMDASALEIKTKDVGGSDLDRKLAGKKAKTTVDDSSVMRAPAKPAILEAAESEAAAETAPATKDNAGSR